ncbi:MAG: hypothetical protein K0Q49_1924, partial [Haloplasmataceae bacterium]|nr:hypothetical protein [Haloplasmataceae bacterium]
KPFLKISLMVDLTKNDYEIFVKDHVDLQQKRVPNIEILIHKDEKDYIEFTNRLGKITELNQVKQEKLQFESDSKSKDAKKISVYDEESKIIKDFQIKISTLNIDVYMHNIHKYKMLVFKLTNVGNHIADQIKFYSKYVTETSKQECIMCGEEVDQFSNLKKDEEIYVRIIFMAEKIKENLKFTIKYNDILGNLYSHDFEIPNIYFSHIISDQPILEKLYKKK